jgi:hypothetical protein
MSKNIYTDRLALRTLHVKDAPDLHAIRSLEEVHRHMFVHI